MDEPVLGVEHESRSMSPAAGHCNRMRSRIGSRNFARGSLSASEQPSLASASAGSAASLDARRIVLGAAIGFGVAQVRVFVESLRATGYAGDATLLIRWPGLRVG